MRQREEGEGEVVEEEKGDEGLVDEEWGDEGLGSSSRWLVRFTRLLILSISRNVLACGMGGKSGWRSDRGREMQEG